MGKKKATKLYNWSKKLIWNDEALLISEVSFNPVKFNFINAEKAAKPDYDPWIYTTAREYYLNKLTSFDKYASRERKWYFIFHPGSGRIFYNLTQEKHTGRLYQLRQDSMAHKVISQAIANLKPSVFPILY